MKYHRLKYRLCMQHSFDGKIEHKHQHLIEIEIVARQMEEDFLEFASMNSILEEVFGPYQYKYLNEFPEFEGDTSIEHLGEVFYVKVKHALEEQHWKFARFEISETPLRIYAIVEETF
ncbi:6-carboxytetrahydropterin synthase [Lachnospiraceae bacterium KK002]